MAAVRHFHHGLLGQRAGTTLPMLWSHVSLTEAVWTIPGGTHAGDKVHVVPLPPLAVRLLKALQPITGNAERVFHGVSAQNEERDWWGRIRDRAYELAKERKVTMPEFTRHDLRRTCATGLTRLGATRFVCSRVLGHAEPGITGVYDRHSYAKEKKAALASWARHVERIMSDEDANTGSNVVSITG